MDWTGRYKMVQYFTQRFYAPLLVSAWGTAVHGTFGASVINDFPNQSFSGTVEFTMRRWRGGVAGTWWVLRDAGVVVVGLACIIHRPACLCARTCLFH